MDFEKYAINMSLDQFEAEMRKRNRQELYFYNAALEQLGDMRMAAQELGATARVISYHTSKSAILPVVEFTLPDNLGKLVMRENFYDTKISFELNRALPKDTLDRMAYKEMGQYIAAVYCEGFPKNRVYDTFAKDQSRFTLATSTLNKPYAMRLISGIVAAIKQAAPKPPAAEPPFFTF